jgi:hypothetical protein
MSWSDFDQATNALVADLRAGQDQQPEPAIDFEPARVGDAGGHAADGGYPDTRSQPLGGYVAHDEYDNEDELTVEQAGEALTELAVHWDTLSPDEREFTTELAQDLLAVHQARQTEAQAEHVLGEVVRHLDAEGYSVERFAEALQETGGDLEMALHVMDAYGPEPKNLDEALGQTVRYARENRQAQHYDDGSS